MVFIMNYGLRAGGGIGEKMGEQKFSLDESTAFEFYSFIFFIVFPFFLMNIIFGIIIGKC
jgi:hypothetical protein